MDIKLIVTDLDETVVSGEGNISRRTVEAFSSCREAGVHLAVATARSWMGARVPSETLGVEYVVCSNGSRLMHEGSPAGGWALGSGLTARLLAELKKCPSLQNIAVETADGIYHNRRNLPPGHAYNHGIFTDFEQETDLDAFQIFAGISREQELLNLEKLLADCSCIHYRGTPRYAFVRKGISKLSAVEHLACRLGISLSRTAAFGDDWADIGLLKACGCGVAMENGLPEAKSAARFVTGSCENDGVAEFIEKEILTGWRGTLC